MSTANSRVPLPREHGSWFMWGIPFLIGMLLTHVSWQQICLLIAVLFAFLSMTPALILIKNVKSQQKYYRNWFLVYAGIAALFGLILLPFYPWLLAIAGLAVPFFLITVYFVKRKTERHLLNDLSGIIALNLTILASYYVGSGSITWISVLYLAYLIPYFFGSALHIKSLIRERNNQTLRRISLVYNLLLPFAYLLVSAPRLLAVGSLLAYVRVVVLSPNSSYKPLTKVLTIGIIEIISSILFGCFFIWAFFRTN